MRPGIEIIYDVSFQRPSQMFSEHDNMICMKRSISSMRTEYPISIHCRKRFHRTGPITLDLKCAGARSAGNPHATCDVAGAGNGTTETSNRARRWKRWIQPSGFLRVCRVSARPYQVSDKDLADICSFLLSIPSPPSPESIPILTK